MACKALSEWGDDDHAAAMKMGWWFLHPLLARYTGGDAGPRRFQAKLWNVPDYFATDHDVFVYVATQAAAGDPLCAKAMRILDSYRRGE
jgi:hypothetical protein